MAGELLRNSDSKALPQRIQRGSSYTPASGDTSELELFDSEVYLQESDGDKLQALVGNLLVKQSVEITRPSDTNGYSIEDAVADSTSGPSQFVLTGAARSNALGGIIKTVKLFTDDTDTVNARFRVYFFNELVTAINDNDSFALAYSDLGKLVGFVEMELDSAGSIAFDVKYPDIPFICAGGTDDLQVILTTIAPYTPASAQKFTVEVVIAQN